MGGLKFTLFLNIPEAYSKPYLTFAMELYVKIVVSGF